MKILNDMFKDAPACKTYAGALKRIEKMNGYIAEAEIHQRIKPFVMQRTDGMYIAVAFLPGDMGHYSMMFLHHNICVVN